MGEPVIEEREIRISDKPIKSRGEMTFHENAGWILRGFSAMFWYYEVRYFKEPSYYWYMTYDSKNSISILSFEIESSKFRQLLLSKRYTTSYTCTCEVLYKK